MPVDVAEFKAAFLRAASPEASREEAIALVARQLKILEALSADDALDELAAELNAAKGVLMRLARIDDKVVQSHLKQLQAALPAVGRLLAQKTKRDDKLPPGHAAVRKGLVEGDLPRRLGDAAVKAAVIAWAAAAAGSSADEVDDLLAAFRADVIADLKLLEAVLRYSRITRAEIEAMATTQALPKYRREQLLDMHRPNAA